LPYIHGVPTLNEPALSAVGEIIKDNDTDKQFPVTGFGARLPPREPTSHECHVNIDGDANFAPCDLDHLARAPEPTTSQPTHQPEKDIEMGCAEIGEPESTQSKLNICCCRLWKILTGIFTVLGLLIATIYFIYNLVFGPQTQYNTTAVMSPTEVPR